MPSAILWNSELGRWKYIILFTHFIITQGQNSMYSYSIFSCFTRSLHTNFRKVTSYVKCKEGRLNGLDTLRMNCVIEEKMEERRKERKMRKMM
jgi:hypothetical protein